MKKKDDWLASYGNYLIGNRHLIKTVGSSSAILLGELISWKCLMVNKGKASEEGSFYMSQQLIESRIGFSPEKQLNCIRKLKEVGILDYEKRGIPCRNHYTINKDKIREIIELFKSPQQVPSYRLMRMPASAEPSLISNNIKSKNITDAKVFSSKRLIASDTMFGKQHAEHGLGVHSPLIKRRNKTPVEFEKLDRKRYNGVVLDIINYWNSSPGLSHHRMPPIVNGQFGTPTKTFVQTYETLSKIISGKYFTSVGMSNKDRVYTKDEIISAIDRFKLMATNPSYYPVDKGPLKKIGMLSFFYNPYSNRVPSQFLRCLDEEPRPVTSSVKKLEDKYPQFTTWLKELYIDRVLLGAPVNFNRLDENKFIRGSELLYGTIRRLQKRLNMLTTGNEWCKIVIDSLIDKWGRSDIHPGHLSSEYTYNDTVVRYLKGKGRID